MASTNLGEFAALQTQTMTEIVRRFPRPEHILSPLFPDKPINGNVAVWDVVKGERKMAKYISLGSEAHIRALTGRQRKSSEVLYIKVKKVLDEQTINFIDKPGELNVAYGEQAITDELESLDRQVENLREFTAARILTTGKLDINYPGSLGSSSDVRVSIDYGVDSTHLSTATTLWSTTASATPVEDILDWSKIIERDSWVTPTDGYLNRTVMNLILKNSAVRDLIKYTFGQELAFTGQISRLANVNLHVYDRGWLDENGSTFRYFIPDDKFLLVAPDNLGSSFVAPARENNNQPGKFARSWETEDPKNVWILVGKYELPVLQNPDQILCATIA